MDIAIYIGADNQQALNSLHSMLNGKCGLLLYIAQLH